MKLEKSGKWFLTGGLLLLLITAVTLPALAQDNEVTDDEVNAIAKNMFCPVCESTPLDVCGTQACAEWRELIRTQLAEGMTEDEIYEYFARQYGDGVLAEPPKRGANLILWFFPAIAVILGGVLLGRYMMSLRTEAAEPAGEVAASPPISEAVADQDYLAKVEAELQQRNTGE
ncbi:MAG TPA: cytochrome c-type biogenesis protein CcmH [Anaerolineae bacterium]|nr:cytochrome c-type biogenesis protein CcmH [Anaerolineae bacterium]HIP73739.1 cytochrome c-type biogenesis protein CcmH [Anaerolineae bacterium]